MTRPHGVHHHDGACASTAPAERSPVAGVDVGAQIAATAVHEDRALTSANVDLSTSPQPLLLENKTPLPPRASRELAEGVDQDGADAGVGAGGITIGPRLARLVDTAIELLVDRELDQAFRSGPVYSRLQLRDHIRDRWRIRRRELARLCAETQPATAAELVDDWRMVDVRANVAASARRMANICEDIDVAEWARYVFADVPDVDQAVTVAIAAYTEARPAGRQWWRDAAADLGAELGSARAVDADTVEAHAKARWWGDPELMEITVATWRAATDTKASV